MASSSGRNTWAYTAAFMSPSPTPLFSLKIVYTH
jgi:hypothetical protein